MVVPPRPVAPPSGFSELLASSGVPRAAVDGGFRGYSDGTMKPPAMRPKNTHPRTPDAEISNGLPTPGEYYYSGEVGTTGGACSLWFGTVLPVVAADSRWAVVSRAAAGGASGSGESDSMTAGIHKKASETDPLVPSPDELCVRCMQGQKHTSNSLRRVTAALADRVQVNLAFLMEILSTQDLREKLVEAGHSEDTAAKWLKAIHQKPGKYTDRLPHVVIGAWIHKVCVPRGCVSGGQF